MDKRIFDLLTFSFFKATVRRSCKIVPQFVNGKRPRPVTKHTQKAADKTTKSHLLNGRLRERRLTPFYILRDLFSDILQAAQAYYVR